MSRPIRAVCFRYQGNNFYKNLELVQKLTTIAETEGVMALQLTLAWVLAQNVVAIPDTKRRTYLDANVAASNIALSPSGLAALDSILPVGSVAGDAYPVFS